MIQKIKIENFQSHKKTELEFDKGVNVIVGSSNSGKTAILRAFNWALTNKPTGLSICSNWNVDDKGNIIKPIKVEVTNDKGVVERNRSKSFNGYHVDGEQFGAIKTDVPDKVHQVFNLDNVNVQLQMDSPFLLSMGGPEATKLLNKVVKLDCIDTVLSKSEAQRRETNSKLKFCEEELKKAQDEVDRLGWVKDAVKWLERISVYEKKVEDIEKDITSLNSEINNLETLQGSIVDVSEAEDIANDIFRTFQLWNSYVAESMDLLKNIEQLKKLEIVDLGNSEVICEELEKLFAEQTVITTDIQKLSQDIVTASAVMVDVSVAEQCIEELKVVCSDDYRLRLFALEKDVYDYEGFAKALETSEIELKTLESQLPKVCPLCGSPL